MQEYSKEKLLKILFEYGIYEINEFEMKDTSHGDDDVRHNYIIDNRYVLRANSAPVMTEERLSEINRLIDVYKEFGIVSPYYLRANNGCFVIKDEGNTIYLSEYLDLRIADDVIKEAPTIKEDLKKQRLIMISRFAQQYKNRLKSNYYSMYSIFDLSLYDIPYGVDEKQQNADEIYENLKDAGEEVLAEKYKKENERIREKLLPIYKDIPCCVFQGDENFSNVCLDEQNQIVGLFDYNMSGMDTNANYLANNAFMGYFVLDDDVFEAHDAEWAFHKIIESFYNSTELIRKYYVFTEKELEAYFLYAKIYMFSSYANASAFQTFLKKKEYMTECIKLINFILDWEK